MESMGALEGESQIYVVQNTLRPEADQASCLGFVENAVTLDIRRKRAPSAPPSGGGISGRRGPINKHIILL